MKNLKFLTALFITFINFQSFAGYSQGKGISITPEKLPNDKVFYKSGETAILQGNICAVSYSFFSKKSKCKKLKGSLQVKAFYPDATTEVTGQLNLTRNGKSTHYAFTTPELNTVSENVFKIVVGPMNHKLEKFLKTQAKIERRILFFNKRIEWHTNKNSHEFFVKWLTKMRDKLVLVSSRITKLIEEDPSVIAQMNIPLQVDNESSSSFYYSSIFNKQKISFEIPRGQAFAGESRKLNVRVANLNDREIWFPVFDEQDSNHSWFEFVKDRYSLRLSFNDSIIYDSGDLTLATGSSFEKEITLDNLNPLHLNNLKLDLYRAKKFKFWNNSPLSFQKVGNIYYEMPVSQDEVAPKWENILPVDDLKFTQTFPNLKGTLKDDFGRIDEKSLSLIIDKDGNTQDYTSSLNVVTGDEFKSVNIEADFSAFAEGLYSFVLKGSDYANNFSEVLRSFRVDRTSPSIDLANSDNVLTNNPSFILDIDIFDHSPVEVSILHNGIEVLNTNQTMINHEVTLVEELNTFEIRAVDAAGNIAGSKRLENIVLDTIPPTLSDVSPIDGATVNFLEFAINGTSSETLSDIQINNVASSLTNNGTSFSGSGNAMSEGSYSFTIKATDLAGNITEETRDVQVILKVLNGDLITIVPQNDGKLMVQGMAYASIPGIEITIDGGFFNSEDVISQENGSFSAILKPFSQVRLSATHEESGRSDTITLDFQLETTLAGIVKNTYGEPLPGVTVSIVETGESAVTDGTGAFKIMNPSTGDKLLSFDGTTIPEDVSGTDKKYSKTNIAVSIGTKQFNVLEDTVYLAPTIMDGTETSVSNGIGVTVTSPHAEGVMLDIPSDTITFPDGTNTGVISVEEISSDVTSVPVPEFAVPDTVYAFEPSGVTFSEPVQLTVPNVNELPEGIQLVVLSKNSSKGIWEIDGLARVDIGGQTITTEENAGITHFSEIFVAPIGPTFKEYGGTEKPGADNFNGAVTASISTPSYKVLGQDIASGLIYNSQWASPNIVLTNLFDVPRQEYEFKYVLANQRSIFGKATVEQVGKGWIEPDYIEAQFSSEDLISEKIRFDGIPQKSIISYAMDLSLKESGVYPFQSRYEMHLKQLTVGSINTSTKKLFGSTKTKRDHFSETRQLEQIYPSDISGTLIVQNQKNSEYGKGWKLTSGGRLLLNNSSLPAFESGTGAVSLYAKESRIETVYENQSRDFHTAVFNGSDIISVVDENNSFKRISISTNNILYTDTIPLLTGTYGFSVQNAYPNCTYYVRSFNRARKIEDIFELPDGKLILTDSYGHLVKWDNQFSELSGSRRGIPRSTFREGNFCSTTGVNCGGRSWRPGNDCWYSPNSSGYIQNQGFSNGNLSSSAYNTPKSIIVGNKSDTILVADYGNNRIREIDLNNGLVSTFAGNGQTYDNGDGGPAINASIYHPQGLVKDSLGNIFVSTGRGYIRKISIDGRIETIAGKSLEDGGIFSFSGHAKNMNFVSPYGLALDEEGGILYVADTGHHRVVSIDLNTLEAKTVAGTNECSSVKNDGKSALLGSLCHPTQIGFDGNNNLLVFDSGHKSVRRITLSNNSTSRISYVPKNKDNSVLYKNTDGSFELVQRSGNTSIFSSNGLLIEQEFRIGNKVEYIYDDEDRLTAMIDPLGGETIYNYLGDNLSSITDPMGRTTSFAYDGNYLTDVTYPNGETKSFAYNDEGLLSETINERNISTSFEYNEWKRLSKVIKPDSTEIVVQDKKSLTIGNNFDSNNVGSLKSLDDELIDGIKDAKGNETVFNSDSSGYINKITDASGRVTEVERDLDGRPLKIIRPDESIVTFEYNEFGDLIKKVDSLTGITLEYDYNEFGQLIAQTDVFGNILENNFDETTGLLSYTKNALAQISSNTYNDFGLVTSSTNSLNHTISYNYDDFGNTISQEDALGYITSFERDDAGNVTTVTNAKGQITTNEYDLMNRLISVTDAKGKKTSYTYLPTGELSSIVDPEFNVTAFEYNNLGQLVKKVTPLGQIMLMSYDENGNVISETDPNGDEKTYEYDNLDQLIRKVTADNVYDFEYDVRGNMVLAQNNESIIEFSYIQSEAGSLVSQSSFAGRGSYTNLPNYTLSFDYDVAGNRTLLSTPFGDYSYEYDNGSRLIGLTNHLGQDYDFSYDNGNRLTHVDGPVVSTVLSLDDTNFLTNLVHKKSSGATLTDFTYSRDVIGNRTQMRTPAGNFDYDYDQNNQLVTASNPESSNELFNYDSLGNRLSDQNQGFTFDAQKQRLLEDATYLYSYDNNGNLTQKVTKDFVNTTKYIYSAENRLLGIDTFVSGTKVKEINYVYDVLGRRVHKDVIDLSDNSKSFTRSYVYDGNEVIAQTDGNSAILATYTHSTLRTDDVLSLHVTTAGKNADVAKNDTTYHYIKDGQGTITDIVDGSGNIVQHYVYSSFGRLLVTEDGSGNDISTNKVVDPYFTYTGREYDRESGLYYYRARMYDATIGRFLSEDPHQGTITRASSFASKYVYTENNPTKYNDASGRAIELPAIWGNWCGPYNNDGKDWSTGTKDNIDQRCKKHDQQYADADAYRSNLRTSGNFFAPYGAFAQETGHYFYHHLIADLRLIGTMFNHNNWKNSRGNYDVGRFIVANAIGGYFAMKTIAMFTGGLSPIDMALFAVDKYEAINWYASQSASKSIDPLTFQLRLGKKLWDKIF